MANFAMGSQEGLSFLGEYQIAAAMLKKTMHRLGHNFKWQNYPDGVI